MGYHLMTLADRLIRAVRGYALKILDWFGAEYRKGDISYKIFADIYKKNAWRDESSRSGSGSNLRETAAIRKELPTIFNKYSVKSMLDIPCGDYFWMKEVDLGDIQYIGADLVGEIISSNKKYEKPSVNFCVKNLLIDPLPKVDLILCRDCLVHLSNGDIKKALSNIVQSESGYLLTTTFTHREINKNILTGSWRALNLVQEPFNLPPPLLLINEDHPTLEYRDKSLALWRISDLRDVVEKCA